ncbi:biopolymer transporter ExbD [Marinobacterium nitratireducens]|uniref:Biopolymer transporter ExbD n=1 Tax=Marinobacterium nitratireducens TaxID=518897 RepID=A0A917ZEI4_9GAMM|nr:biopolymer transporter ExbD [Marinobacterium nitratireducens]GGO80372.1 biopolymer transporter ExbD [Marinobacterium nitratireducens]
MKFERRRQEEVSVNLTPLIDVVFLLLIFFMVSTTFTRETHLEVDLPEASAEPGEASRDLLEVLVNAQGQYSINGKPLVNSEPDTLRKALQQEAGSDRDQPLLITADGATPHQSVVTVMDVAGQLGFVHLSITTQEPAD